jgi:hypothetical protein
LLAAATLEDDPTLQEMWAGLIANATDPKRRQDAKKVFTHILASLEPLDVMVVRYLNEHGEWKPQSYQPGRIIEIPNIASTLGVSRDEIQLSLNNLSRIGCLRFDQPGEFLVSEESHYDTSPAINSDEGSYHLTSLATTLLDACQT